MVKLLNFHIDKPHEFRKFWMHGHYIVDHFSISVKDLSSLKSLKIVQSSTIKRVVHKIIIMAFNEIKHFVAFFQL